MSEFTIDVEIGAPPERVFAYLADGTRTPDWYEAVLRAKKTTDGPTGLGTRYEFTRALPQQGEVTNEVEVTEFERPALIAFTSRRGPTPFVYRYSIEPTAGGSRVTLDGKISGEGLKGPAALLAPFAGKFFSRGMVENLATLRTQLEG